MQRDFHHGLSAWKSVRPSSLRVSRAIIIVLDGAGIGALPDAAQYGDAGSNTLGHVAGRVPLAVPTLRALGLGRVVEIGGATPTAPLAAFGRMAEASPGKDSVTGYWELTGVTLAQPFPLFPGGFPADAIRALERRIGRPTIGNVAASGTEIIERLGREHLRTGAPIVYTSADSVCQIAVHDSVAPVEELYRFCQAAFEVMAEGLGVGRVIARPFVGEPGAFHRTTERRDFAQAAPGQTLLDRAAAAGLPVVAIGKIDDLFAGRGISSAIHTTSDAHGLDELERALAESAEGLMLTNLIDFDTVYGHRNDVAGYAANLEAFDRRLAALLPRLGDDDLFVITADHGNDPTTPSTDHSREYVPILMVGASVQPGVDVGTRSSFADLGQTLAEALGVAPLACGTSFLDRVAAGAVEERSV